MTATIAWILFAIYFIGTFYLAWLGHKQTTNFEDFAVGKRDMGPGIAGLTLGACLASTATFVINPGLVFQFGFSAFFALSIPFIIGIFVGLAVLGPGFRKHGGKAITLPLWIGDRYKSPSLRLWFALLTIFNIFYIVLIVKGAANVMSDVMGVSYKIGVAVVVLTVFSYIFLGGTYAHAYTNTAQGAIMLVVALIIAGFATYSIFSGQEALETIQKTDPHYLSLINPNSFISNSYFSVIIAPFVLGVAIVTQPHLLIKSLYLKESRDMGKFMALGGGSFVIFSLVLLAGFAARILLVDPVPLNQLDKVTSAWIVKGLPELLAPFIGVAILAAAMSTLDGLLVAVSCIVGADVIASPIVRKKMNWDDKQVLRASMIGGQVTIILLGVISWVLSYNPPELVSIFGQFGVFAMLTATVPSLIYGVAMNNPPRASIMLAVSALGLALHCLLYFGSVKIFGLIGLELSQDSILLFNSASPNPTVTAAVALLVCTPLPGLIELPLRILNRQKSEDSNETMTSGLPTAALMV